MASLSTPKPHKTSDAEYSLQPVTTTGKYQGFWASMMVLVGFTFFSPSMTAGGKLALGMNATDFFLAVGLGNLFLTIYCSILARIGQQTGMSLDLLCRRVFGTRGSCLPSCLILFTQIGWFGVGVAMFAIPLAGLLDWPVWPLVLLTGSIMTLSACVGIKALVVLGSIAVPCIAILGGYSVLWGLNEAGSFSHIFALAPEAPLPLAAGIGLVVGNFISGGTTVPNFTRFSRTAHIAIFATGMAFFAGNILMMFFGAVGGAVTGEADIFNILILQGLALPAFVTLGLNIWTTNNNALYSAGLGLSNVTGGNMRILTLIGGLGGTLVAIWLYNNFISYLSLLGGMIPAIGAVLIVHFFRHPIRASEQDSEQLVRIPALLALVCGSLVGVLCPWGVAPVNALLSAGLVFLILDCLPSRTHSSC